MKRSLKGSASSAKGKTKKRPKMTEKEDSSPSDKSKDLSESEDFSLNSADLFKVFEERRSITAKSVLDFNFNKKRVRVLSEINEINEVKAKGILYWMSRDCRVQDNWAFLFAQRLALKNNLPLTACFCLVPKFLEATIRHYKFLLKGLEEVARDCHELNIPFHLLLGPAPEEIPKFVEKYCVGAVICDFSPLRLPRKWVEDVKTLLPSDVTLCQVDAHNIVPVWISSDKQEYAARTIRSKITSKLDLFLTEFPPLVKHPYDWKTEKDDFKQPEINWEKVYDFLECDRTVDAVDWAKPGYREACKMLRTFCEKRLCKYNGKRNDPLEDVLSNLSPWFHYGQISVQRCILTSQEYKRKYPDSVSAFCEEAIIRRELSDNFCYYNENYDNLNGIPSWALKTLNDHRKDRRSYIYTKEELETAKTHDDLWNSAQIQLVQTGKMHGFLRMYWAKKILEWTSTPEDALKIAIYLNDRYSLDGRDPNGYVGCMWSIGGVHDQGWTERPIFGKIRFMNYEGCKRKFDVAGFVARYGGKTHKKK